MPDRCGKCDTCLYVAAAQKLCTFKDNNMYSPAATAQFWNQAVSRVCLAPPAGMTAYDPERDYLEFVAEENGNYSGHCICGVNFRGPKRAVLCKRCIRSHRTNVILQRLQDIYCGLRGGTNLAYQADLDLLAGLTPQVKSEYYRAVFSAFQEQLQHSGVVYAAFNREVAKQIKELADLLVSLKV